MNNKNRRPKHLSQNMNRTVSIPTHAVQPRDQRAAIEPDATQMMTVIDARAERRAQLSFSAIRLIPMAMLGIAIYTALIVAVVVLKRLELLSVPISYSASIESYALYSMLFLGFIPIVTSSILIVAFKPTTDYVFGLKPDPTSFFSAPIAGFLIGLLLWCITQFISTFDVPIIQYLSTPEIWRNGMHYIGKTSLSALVVILVAVILPATSIELLARGLIQQALTTGRRYLFAGVASSLLFALPFFDVSGLIILILWEIVSFWIRLRTDSLIASSLATASFSLAMIFSRSIFTAIGQQLFQIPLIEVSKVRVYLMMCGFILIVLLLIPTALINATGKRIDSETQRFEKPRRRRKSKKGEREDDLPDSATLNRSALYTLWGVASLCVAVLAALVFLA